MGIDPFSLFVQIAIGLAVGVVGYLLMPQPKRAKPPEAQDLQAPTAEAGRPIPVFWGTLEIKGPNILWHGDLDQYSYETDAG